MRDQSPVSFEAAMIFSEVRNRSISTMAMPSLAEILATSSFVALGVFIALMPHIKVCAAPHSPYMYYLAGAAIVAAAMAGVFKAALSAISIQTS